MTEATIKRAREYAIEHVEQKECTCDYDDFSCAYRDTAHDYVRGYVKGMQDPDAQKELLEEVEKALTKAISWYQNRGNTPHGIDEFPALLQKLRAVKGSQNAN